MVTALNPSRPVDVYQTREQLLHGEAFGSPGLANIRYSPVDRPSAILVVARSAVLKKSYEGLVHFRS